MTNSGIGIPGLIFAIVVFSLVIFLFRKVIKKFSKRN